MITSWSAAPASAALELIGGQRACRSYTGEPVDDADLVAMLEAATHAPSAENRQPWVFVVVRDAATRRGIDELTKRVWDERGSAALGAAASRLGSSPTSTRS